MHTNSNSDSRPEAPPTPLEHLALLRELNARAVRDSLTAVRRITLADLSRPTPCAAWTLAELLAHMTVQHRGFAAAARGDGEDPAHWTADPPPADPVAAYAAAADDVIAAFATLDTPDRPFTLPEFKPVQTFPALQAIGFHLIDYVVHGWDVARTLNHPYAPDPALLRAALPIAQAVPTEDDHRRSPGSAFRPALPAPADATPLDRILTLLGRSPSWTPTPC